MPIFELLQTSPAYLYATLALLGLLIGSFLNVVIHRLPVMMERQWKLDCLEELHPEKVPAEMEPYNLVKPDSTCPSCGHAIRAWENIPVISYLFLRGKCSSCKTGISARYPAIEIVSALLAVTTGVYFGATIQTALVCLFGWTLLTLTMIDYDTKLLPDSLTLPLLWIGLLANSFELFTSLQDAVYGAIAGYMFLWTIFWLFKLLTGKDGMGYGDFKLLAAMGAWMGWQALPIVILLSSVVGIVFFVVLMLFKKLQRTDPIPFGPYLAAAGFIAMIWGEQLLNAYLSTMGIRL
ncbi:prepilin peptidase [Endozoicomonas sp. OPT23]|uniref:prepilin peptidase n=1 Tax=Endozoicomonas sp. OPT23 TaxID=2072845 RepID=UPI00129A3001|nr:A24 family peptidase [Endozoicomonas sp. OPT23]MRI33703.1 prepilin peptidase [Endozoicomonas sp. OPT23]